MYAPVKCLVDATLFTAWFHHKFVSTVQLKLRMVCTESKAILLVENCSAHPSEEIVALDGKIFAMFLLLNVTSLIQLMDQGVAVSIRPLY